MDKEVQKKYKTVLHHLKTVCMHCYILLSMRGRIYSKLISIFFMYCCQDETGFKECYDLPQC